MGLKSLPILNKSGISMYWENVWDSILLYRKYSLSFFYINKIIYYFLDENLYYHNIKIMAAKGLFDKRELGLKKIVIDKFRWAKLKHYFFGKILILKNQGWVIILVNFYTSKKFKLIRRYDLVKFNRKYIKRYLRNYTKPRVYNNRFRFWNYKNIF